MTQREVNDQGRAEPVGEAVAAAEEGGVAGGTQEMLPGDLAQKVEAALMALDRPLSAARLAEAIGNSTAKGVNAAIQQLNEVYKQTGRTFRVEEVAGGLQILTLPEFGAVVAALQRARQQTRLSPAALETLAIIAYKQPILRADVEAIRGVACGEVIRTLMDHRLVKIVGRAEELGRPMLYGTTKTFLEVFGLADLKDLPKVEELRPKYS
jgi:segregation and condensation protein B